ncbi:dimethyladenosine transferase 1, mitochondrial-like [Anneissia japonica]|uniref:dimethyladenosine transferase 1, mitochondrial-like n=1 Tax=Anneissia japonica TaxID=1529436 RepID=UPI001425A8DF|nr:dimethyladenosine transferase 1, mitochondrial-like [Anneissia japonica]XP_033112868.1 dimethyladenosine transferase 1, mitochondrial-like [Anneissia japonica]
MTAVMRLPPLPTLREVIRLYGLRAEKQLSQNFLMDLKLTNKFVRQAGKLTGSHVCEVGPGPGAITRSILQAGVKNLVVVEKDERFKDSLEMLAEASNGTMSAVLEDILRFRFEDHFPKEIYRDWQDECPDLHLIGNLPFNVSTPLIMQWLEAVSNHTGPFSFGRTRMLLTFQKEVAERLAAPPGHEQRSRPSVMAQYLCSVKHCYDIPGAACVPQPKVDIGVVHLTPLKQPQINLPFKLVEKVVRSVFHFRQKYCQRGVEILFPHGREDLLNEVFEVAAIDPTTKPYKLTMDDFKSICWAYYDICERIPGLIDYNYR